MRFPCSNDTVAVAMHVAMKNGKICFSLRKFLVISPAIQKIASDCGCDASVLLPLFVLPLELSPNAYYLEYGGVVWEPDEVSEPSVAETQSNTPLFYKSTPRQFKPPNEKGRVRERERGVENSGEGRNICKTCNHP